MAKEPDLVRCIECRHEYELPPIGEEIGCPDCGGVSWVSTRIPGATVTPVPGHGHARWM